MQELTIHSVERFVVNHVFHNNFKMNRITVHMADGKKFQIRLFSDNDNISMEFGSEDYRTKDDPSAF